MQTSDDTGRAGHAGPGAARMRLEWSDFRIVLAIARLGSVARAVPALGASHSTLLRRLDQIEARLKTRLFHRGRSGYVLTSAGHEIERAARQFEAIAVDAETRASGQDLRPGGEVRLSVTSIVIDHLLPGVLAQFRSAFPGIQIELIASREHANLRRREADIAIRIAESVPDWLVGRKLGALRFKVYAGRRPRGSLSLRTVDEMLGEKRWIAFERDAHDLKFDRWLAAHVPDEHVALRVDNFSHAATMVRAGIGVALLPTFVEPSLPGLQPATATIPELETPVWMVTHPELKNAARIQALMRAFGPALANALLEAPS